jgi:hypothetical protein
VCVHVSVCVRAYVCACARLCVCECVCARVSLCLNNNTNSKSRRYCNFHEKKEVISLKLKKKEEIS